MVLASFRRLDGASLLRTIVLLAVLAIGAGLVLPARADSGRQFRPCIMVAHPGDRARAIFASADRFDCHRGQRSFPVGTVWLISPPLRTRADQAYVARFASNWSVSVALYIRYADGAIRRVGFTHRTAPRFLGVGGRYLLPIPVRDAAPVRLLWRVRQLTNVRGVMPGAEVLDTATLERRTLGLTIAYALCAGIALALIVGHLALYVALRQRFLLVYVGMVAVSLAFLFVSSGAMTMLWPDLDVHLRQRAATLLFAAGTILVLLFGRSFFPSTVFTRGLRRVSNAAIAALILSTGAILLMPPHRATMLDDIDSCLYMLVMAMVPIVVLRATAQRQLGLTLFAAAWGMPILLVGLRIMVSFGLMRGGNVFDLVTIGMMTIEALVAAIGIVWRIHRLGRERDEARAEEIAARLLADVDPLTGLLNRRAFLARAIGREADQMLLLVDIDHFKAINDQVGHDSGDEVLRGFAQALRMVAPADALVARLGGEEFALLLPMPAAMSPAAIHRALREVRMPFDLSVTCSLGACTGPMVSERAWQAMYRTADRALYEAKAAGRDRVQVGAPLVAVA
ncbi:GGDEF domain-containing protein [Sphingomonas abaci]|uniref:diguanylate cyclase n=1 Tax=Sphingomonas abaci TaxID=237611 RepID=A0A7W7AGQ0_9SPHN|nr:diguanylate cyclase [Sphingomonas abaci]MBB4616717.1 diguanylate cyclase (GGDEF)-like protein [Sphingomonas abaci]